MQPFCELKFTKSKWELADCLHLWTDTHTSRTERGDASSTAKCLHCRDCIQHTWPRAQTAHTAPGQNHNGCTILHSQMKEEKRTQQSQVKRHTSPDLLWMLFSYLAQSEGHKLFIVYTNCLVSIGTEDFKVNIKLTSNKLVCIYTDKYLWFKLLSHLVSSLSLTFGSPKMRKWNSCSQQLHCKWTASLILSQSWNLKATFYCKSLPVTHLNWQYLS